MAHIRSIYGKPFVVEPDAAADSPDRKWPDPDVGVGILDHASIYYSRDHAETEWQRLWSRTWNIAGRESDVAERGSFFRFDLGTESFIIVRDDEDEIRAFYNVCQHRGSQIVQDDFGKGRAFVCPFHSWCWGLDGELKQITDRETFDPDVIADNPPLAKVKCETWGGFVFINLDPAARPLKEFLGELPDILDLYRAQDMIVVKDVSATWPVNWKIALDAFMEGYHAHARHPELINLIDDYHFQFDLFSAGHSKMIIPFAYKSPRFSDQQSMTAELGALLAEVGIDGADYDGRLGEVRGVYKQARRDWAARNGLDFTPFSDSQVTDDWNFNIFPNVTFNVHPEGLLVMRFRPHATDPEICHYDVWVLAHRSENPEFRLPFYMDTPDANLSGDEPRPIRRYIEHGEQGLGYVLDQDGQQLPLVQRGMHSRGFGGLRLGYQEIRLRHYYKEYRRYFEK